MDNDTKLIHLALDAGEIMIKNGAETFRVKDTMRRILGTTGRSHIIDAIGETYVAEAATKGTALVGLTLDQAQRRINSEACPMRSGQG